MNPLSRTQIKDRRNMFIIPTIEMFLVHIFLYGKYPHTPKIKTTAATTSKTQKPQ